MCKTGCIVGCKVADGSASDFLNYTQDTVKDYQREPIPPQDCEPNLPELIDFDGLMQRIRHHVLVNRLRVRNDFHYMTS